VSSAAGVVALLFTDLVGSTELLARLGDDAAEDLRRVHFRLLRSAIDANDGREVKTLGDGVMAAFASPVQAVGCAVSIQRAVEEYNRGHPEAPLRVRVGLHAGEPVQAEEDFHGTAVVVAKRLCDEAEGGQILASQLVQGLVGSRGGFMFRPAGRLQLKGLPEPIPAVSVGWRPQKARSSGRRPRPAVTVAPRGPPLVGRDEQLAFLEEELKRAAAGEFRCVLVLGEPGVGKTRLAGELVARHGGSATGLAARAHPLGATTAFGVWAEALERHLRSLPAEDVERLCAGFLDDLARLLRSVAAVRGRGPEHEPPRGRLLEGLAVVLANLAVERPVVIVVDDVHLADPSSLEALHYLAHSCPDARLLVVTTARPAELTAEPVAGDVLLGLEQEGLLRRLAVGPLRSDDLRDLSEVVVGDRVPNALVEWLEERSRGNPLYAIGLVRALLEEGADLSAPVLRRLPEALSERVANRLRQFDEPAVGLLELLAVLGRRVELRSLVALSGRAPDELAGIVEGLVRARLVAEEERGLELVYEIAHPLIQESIYQGIGAARRRGLHRQVGRGLLSAGRLGEAAPHFVRFAEPGDTEAVVVLRDAVRQAEQRQAYQEALTILGALVELLPAGDPQWAEVVDALSWDAQWVVDHRADTHAALGIPALRAMDQALEGLDDPARRAPVKLRLASFLAWGTGELEEAEAMGRQALELFQQAKDIRGELLARHELAFIAGIRGDPRTLRTEAHRVAEEARAAGDEAVLARALRTVAMNGIIYGRFEEGRGALEELAEAARRRGDAYALTVNLSFAALGLAMEGRVDEAERVLEGAKRTNPRWQDSVLVEYQTIPPWMAGNYPLAVERGLVAVAASPGGLSRRRGLGMIMPALAALEMGKMPEAERFLSLGRVAYGQRDWFHYSDFVRLVEAVLAFRQGRRNEGGLLLRRSVTALLDKDVGPAIPVFLQIPEWIEQPDLAARAADALEQRFRETGGETQRGHARFGRAYAAAAHGDRIEAGRAAAEAVDLYSGVDARGYLACALELLGRVRAGDDRKGAVEALERAAAAFGACGAVWRRDAVAELLRGLGSQGRRTAAAALGPASLTTRERDVARLAAQGYSARQIGERLFIGARTVEGHLARAYGKLGVASKVELARRAAEFDLDRRSDNA
jgi:class 3 adenylate cyclase/DNA-binding CsgD family transcriptional regulator